MSDEVRAGERVRMKMGHADKDGKIMWDMESTWYGFDNTNANELVDGMLKEILDYLHNLSGVKNA